jgi:hypothetical protein
MKTKMNSLVIACTLSAMPVAAAIAAPEFGGDIRFRNELINQNGKDKRFRQRVRARLSAKGTVDENVKYKFQLISGGSDPISGNQSLDGGFSSKGINIDLATFTLKCPLTGSDIKLGKFKNPFFRPGKTELIWDGDLNPEGIAIQKEFGPMFLTLGYLYAEERSGEPDTAIHSIQTGVKLDNETMKIIAAVGFYDYMNMKDRATLVDAADSFGNTATGNTYDNNYGVAEIGVQVDLKKSNLSFVANAVRNTAVNKNHSGYLAGLSYGKKIKVKYNWRKIESDAVVGAFTDSDFQGGGTDGKGHEFGASMKIGKSQKLGLAHFINKTSLTNGLNYNRTMLDYSIKF